MTDADQERIIAECIIAAAELIAQQPGAAQTILDSHLAGSNGRCAKCGPLTLWPCVMVAIAERAVATSR